MHLRALIALCLAIAAVTPATATRVPERPGYGSIEQAVTESDGFWIWENRPQSVRSEQIGLTCVDSSGAFTLTSLTERSGVYPDHFGSCAYINTDSTVVIVRARPVSITTDERSNHPQITIPAGMDPRVHRAARPRDIGRCDGVLVHFTFETRRGVFPNGTPWHFTEMRQIGYFLNSPSRTLDITLTTQGPGPLYSDETILTDLAAASGVC